MNICILLVSNRWKFYECIRSQILRTSHEKKWKEQKEKKVLREVTPIGTFFCREKNWDLDDKKKTKKKKHKKDTSTFVNVLAKMSSKKNSKLSFIGLCSFVQIKPPITLPSKERRIIIYNTK